MNRFISALHEMFPDHMSRGQQTVENFLTTNGWQRQEDQGADRVYTCPMTGDNHFEAEALRRQEARPVEEQAILIVKLLNSYVEKLHEKTNATPAAGGIPPEIQLKLDRNQADLVKMAELLDTHVKEIETLKATLAATITERDEAIFMGKVLKGDVDRAREEIEQLKQQNAEANSKIAIFSRLAGADAATVAADSTPVAPPTPGNAE